MEKTEYTSTVIKFVIPVNPQPASRPRSNFKLGRVYNKPEYKRYLDELYLLTKKYQPSRPLSKAISLSIEFYLERPKSVKRDMPCVKPDLDNYVKAVMDGLKGFWVDDALVVELKASKFYSNAKPFIVVRMEQLEA